MSFVIKAHSNLIIVGGGIIGAAVGYYFKRDNPDKEVIVFERNELCSGNTSLSASLLTRARMDSNVIPLSLETYRVIKELEKITGDPIPVKYTGAIHLAASQETAAQLEKMMKVSSEYGIDWECITSDRAAKMVPWLNASRAEKIFFIPGEAVSDAYLLGMAFVNAAKIIGVKFRKNTEVAELLKNDEAITGIRTNTGVYDAEAVVLAAGVWSTYLASRIGVALPMAPVRSQYWITEQSESLFLSDSPSVIIPEANFYSRPQGKSLLFGIREQNSVYCDLRILPKEIGSYQFSRDNGWQDLIESYDKISPFFLQYRDIGIKHYIAGFSAYTPDNMFVAGDVPEVRGLYIASGCVGAGISVAGGIGLGIAHLAAGKANPFDFSQYRVGRFGTFDPFSKEHLSRCAETRSKKVSG